MRFSLISLLFFGGAVALLVGVERHQAAVDYNDLTGSLVADSSRRFPGTGIADGSPTTGRLVSQPVVPRGHDESAREEEAIDLAQNTAQTDEGEAGSQETAQVPFQSQPMPGQPTPPAAPAAPANAAPQVDESALRYFAARGDTARLQAEISRLRTLYPNWTPPADPLAVRPTSDTQLETMWQLYAQARFADVRKSIADRQSAEAGWQPPADLLERLRLAEARVNLTAASDAKTYNEVIRIAAENPSLLTCSEVDVLWRLADAFSHTEKPARARDAYLYVLNNCDAPSERLATVQKASELLPVDMMEELLATERTPAGGQPEFETLRDELARRLVAQGNSDVALVVPGKYLGRLERLVETQDLASDALLLGWYYYRRDNLGAAERWFRRSNGKEETAAAAEGLALTLTRQNAPIEAESVLYRWRDSSPGTKAAYIAAVANLLALDPLPILDEQVLARMAPVVVSAKDAAAAQQFGWYARAMRQTRTAAQWFAAGLSWKPDDEPSAYGLALSRHDLGDEAGVAALQQAWAGRSDRIANLGEEENRDDRRLVDARIDARTGKQGRLPATAEAVRQDPAKNQPLYRDTVDTAENVPASRPQPVRRQEAYAPQSAAPLPVQRSAPRAVARTVQVSQARGCGTTIDPRDLRPEQALTRGWCLMDLNRPLEAAQAFEVAGASGNQVARSDAAYGRSLAYLRVGLTDKAAVAAASAPQNNTRAVELQSAILADRAVNSFKSGRYRETLVALDQRSQIVPEQRDLMNLRGFAYEKLGRRADAIRVFEALADVGDRDGQRALADITASYR